VRARSEILAKWDALKQLSENKNIAMCVVLPRYMKNRNFNMLLFLSTLAPHLTELKNAFQTGCFNFAQTKSSVELCIIKLSDAAAKSSLKLFAKSLIVN